MHSKEGPAGRLMYNDEGPRLVPVRGELWSLSCLERSISRAPEGLEADNLTIAEGLTYLFRPGHFLILALQFRKPGSRLTLFVAQTRRNEGVITYESKVRWR